MYHFYELISHQFRSVRGDNLIKTFVSNLGGLNFYSHLFLVHPEDGQIQSDL